MKAFSRMNKDPFYRDKKRRANDFNYFRFKSFLLSYAFSYDTRFCLFKTLSDKFELENVYYD